MISWSIVPLVTDKMILIFGRCCRTLDPLNECCSEYGFCGITDVSCFCLTLNRGSNHWLIRIILRVGLLHGWMSNRIWNLWFSLGALLLGIERYQKNDRLLRRMVGTLRDINASIYVRKSSHLIGLRSDHVIYVFRQILTPPWHISILVQVYLWICCRRLFWLVSAFVYFHPTTFEVIPKDARDVPLYSQFTALKEKKQYVPLYWTTAF